MHRVLVGLAIAVGVLAIGAVVAVAVLSHRDARDLSGEMPAAADIEKSVGGIAVPLPGAEEAPPVPPEARPVAVPIESPPADAPREPVDAGDDTAERVATIIESLSDEQEQALLQELQQRRMRRWRDAQKYRLPSGQRLYALQWYQGGKHKLNETQKARIKQFDEILRPKTETALQEMWNQEADLRQGIRDLNADGRREEARGLSQDLQPLRRDIRDAKNALDVEYKEMLRQVLTTEQMEYVESNPATRYRTWVGPSSRKNRTH